MVVAAFHASPAGYDAIVNRGLVPPQKLIAGALTNAGNGGSGYVAPAALASVVSNLVAEHQDFGGRRRLGVLQLDARRHRGALAVGDGDGRRAGPMNKTGAQGRRAGPVIRAGDQGR